MEKPSTLTIVKGIRFLAHQYDYVLPLKTAIKMAKILESCQRLSEPSITGHFDGEAEGSYG